MTSFDDLMPAAQDGSTPKPHEYRGISRAVPKLSACPLCGCAAEAWRHQGTPDDLATVVIMCSNKDAFAEHLDSGCLLSAPPSCFYLPTVREAANYWNGYADWVLWKRGRAVQPEDVRNVIERLKRAHVALLTGFTKADGSLETNVNQRFGYAQGGIAAVIDALEMLVQP